MISYRITGLPAAPFCALYGLDDASLAARGVKRYLVDVTPGFPDRIELRDIEPGEHALLLNYVHQSANTPYRSSHAIYIREGAVEAYDRINKIPDAMRVRLLNLRSFDASDMMVEGDLVAGNDVEKLIEVMLSDSRTSYIHVHYAKRGCFAGRLNRV